MKVHEGKEDNKCEPRPSQTGDFKEDMEAIVKEAGIDIGQPGPSQTGDFEPVESENGEWQCPCCSVSRKRKDAVNKHIKEVHLGNKILLLLLLLMSKVESESR